MIKLSKKDVSWSYAGKFIDLLSGILILPLILHLLPAEEIGMYYLMLTIGSLVTLFDFGFAPQFGRNITYVLSGAQELKREGITVTNKETSINYRLLANMVHTARYVYRRLSFIVLFVMISFGTLYIHNVTDGFSHVSNSLIIWIIYSISVFFKIYYTYYTSLLTGKGLIKEASKANILSKAFYMLLATVLLLMNLSLMGVVIAGLISPFVQRYLSFYYFFTPELKEKINQFVISNKEKIDLFKIIWYNSKKLGIVLLCAFATTKFGLFMAGLYLPLAEIAAYGLMLQLVGMIAGTSGTLFDIYQPRFSSLRVKGDIQSLIKEFAFSMNIFYLLYAIGVLALLFLGQWALDIIGSNTPLPSPGILLIYSLVILLEVNHSKYAMLITTGNHIPFVIPAVIGSVFIVLGNFLILEFTSLGILGLILVQGLVESAYDNWKWPLVVHQEFKISLRKLLFLGAKESVHRIKTYA
jgi:O-antigen/teichoic acid export membrane protein